jgi:hypothetical protein
VTEIATAVPPEVVQNYPHWDCHFLGSYQKVTVGAIWQMQCQGDTELKTPLTLQFPNDNLAYTLVLLKSKKLDKHAVEFDVTGYKPGNFSLPYIVLTDGANAVRVDGLKWEITSVLQVKGPQESASAPPQPLPPFGPYRLDMPLWVWLGLSGLVLMALLVLWSVWLWRRRRRQKLEALKKLDNALTPAMEIHRDMRQWMRMVADPPKMLPPLSRAWRVYLSRKYRFVAIDMPRPALLKELKKWLKTDDRKKVDDLLLELERSLQEPARVTRQDAEQLLQITRTLVDHLEKPR